MSWQQFNVNPKVLQDIFLKKVANGFWEMGGFM
jgi:hypothetical protein